ncbi:hypothetical protein BHE74_00055405 [Ensete ventricosum]|nr:hypothetical protein BHE74_00055405 [Ensete ventricosum]
MASWVPLSPPRSRCASPCALRAAAPCYLDAGGGPLRASCWRPPLAGASRAAAPCGLAAAGRAHGQLPLCRGALAAADRPLAGGWAMPCYPSSLLSLRKRSKNAENDST